MIARRNLVVLDTYSRVLFVQGRDGLCLLEFWAVEGLLMQSSGIG